MIEIPNILEFLHYFDFLRGYPAAYVVLITAALILIVRNWHVTLLVLTIQYLVVGLLFADVLLPHLAFIKVIVGLFICLILYFTARQVSWGQLPEDTTEEEAFLLQQERFVRFGHYMLPTSTPFRFFLALMVAFAVWAVSQQPSYYLPAVPDYFTLAVFALISLGLVATSLTSEPLQAGVGLLTFLIGFELFYSALEQSIAMMAVLAIANVSVVLVIAYLVQARHAFPALLD
jgi:hypothetical protein